MIHHRGRRDYTEIAQRKLCTGFNLQGQARLIIRDEPFYMYWSVRQMGETDEELFMMQLQEWFAREFSFALPVWMFPNVVARLRGTPARLEDLVRSLPPELLTWQYNNQWSIQEHAGHLLDLSELDSTRLHEFTAGATVLTAADRENRKTYAAAHNAASVENILTAFRAERMAFVARLAELDETFVERTALHPRLQLEMRVLDFACFIAEHDDHHLARISEIIRMHGETIAV